MCVFQRRPVASVNGLRWGQYVGSYDMPQPMWQIVTQLPVAIASMVPLVTGPVFGIEPHSTLIMLHSKPAGKTHPTPDAAKHIAHQTDRLPVYCFQSMVWQICCYNNQGFLHIWYLAATFWTDGFWIVSCGQNYWLWSVVRIQWNLLIVDSFS